MRNFSNGLEKCLEELDLRWQVAMLTVRVKKFIQRTGRNLDFKEKRLVSLDKTKIECYNCHRKGHFARECRSGRNQGRRSYGDNGREQCTQRINSTSQALMAQDGLGGYGLGAFESVVSNPKIDRDRVIIEDWNSDDEEEMNEVQTVRLETQTVKTRDDKSGVLTRTGLHRPSVSTARPVYATRPIYPRMDNEIQDLVTRSCSGGLWVALAICWQQSIIFQTIKNFNGALWLLEVIPKENKCFASGGNLFNMQINSNESKLRHRRIRFSWVFFLATKDETSEILCNLIIGLENQLSHNVKIIRCDNGTEFKNHAMNEFCAKKGIKREFSVARTPQQNGVAERKNRTLIEAARTMLADSLLPIPFWAEAVNTACYVLNRVLVTKPQNKTPYELLIGKSPSISFMRPFGCPLTILNTLDSLDKFDGKSDEGYLLGYSTSSKAFRVYNKRTKKVEENLHINFLKDQPNVTGTGSSGKDKGPTQEYILLPLQPHRTRIPIEDVAPAAHEKPSESSPKDNDIQDSEDVIDKEGQHQMPEDEQVLHDELEKMVTQELTAKAMDDVSRQAFKEEKRRIASQKKAAQATSTNKLSTDRQSVSTDRPSVSTDRPFVSTDRPSVSTDRPFVSTDRSSVSTANTPYVSIVSTSTRTNAGESLFKLLKLLPNDGIINGAYDDDEVGAEADFNNMDNTIAVSPIPTLKIHKDHPKGQILGDPTSAVQTRGKIQKASSAQQALVSYIHKQNRTNHKDHQNCLCLACFTLSRRTPRQYHKTYKMKALVEAMHVGMLQFKLQKFGYLLICHMGKRDCYEKRLIEVIKIHTDSNVADLLTKGFVLSQDYNWCYLGSRESFKGDRIGTNKRNKGTDKQDGGTDSTKVSTDRQDEGTADQNEGKNATQTAPTTTSTPTPTIFEGKGKRRKIRKVDEPERPRPTSIRTILTLRPLPKINPKDKGKKRIEEEDKSDTESKDITEAEKKFKQLANDEEVARKVQEEWEAEEEKKRLDEEEATKVALSNEYDFIQARLNADKILAEKLQEEEREIHVGGKKHSDLKTKSFDEIQVLYEKIKRSNDSFIAIGSAEDEKMIKEMNEQAADASKKKVKKDDNVKGEIKEEGTRKRKLGKRKKMKSKKRKFTSKDDEELRLCLTIASDEDKEVDYEILDKKYPILRMGDLSILQPNHSMMRLRELEPKDSDGDEEDP
ncbi:putative ribonuclease H-like domain-containing protein [Tanacetum coccineum]